MREASAFRVSVPPPFVFSLPNRRDGSVTGAVGGACAKVKCANSATFLAVLPPHIV
jgi:hypothetical protein